MRCVDVNVLIYAHRSEMPDSDAMSQWLDDARHGPEPLGIPSVAISGFIRIVTNRRTFPTPSDPATAWTFVRDVLDSPTTTVIEPGARHLGIFERLCLEQSATGNLVPDAYLAAIAIEHGATLYSADRDFARFPGLRWKLPLQDR